MRTTRGNLHEELSRLDAVVRRAGLPSPLRVTEPGETTESPDGPSAVLGCVVGFSGGEWAEIIPGFDFLTAEDSRRLADETREIEDEVAAQEAPEEGPLVGDLAGEMVYRLHESYIPIAERDGIMIVADMRPGPESGRVFVYDDVQADDVDEDWPSLIEFIGSLTCDRGRRRVAGVSGRCLVGCAALDPVVGDQLSRRSEVLLPRLPS